MLDMRKVIAPVESILTRPWQRAMGCGASVAAQGEDGEAPSDALVPHSPEEVCGPASLCVCLCARAHWLSRDTKHEGV